MVDRLLPSSTSLHDKMRDFEFEALQMRDALVEAQFRKLGVYDQPECQEMMGVLRAQTYQAEQRTMQTGEPWRGEVIHHVEEQEIGLIAEKQRAEAETRIEMLTDELADSGVKVVRVDIAIGDNSEILVAYDTEGGETKDPDIQVKLAHFLNDCLFMEYLVTKNSSVYKAKTLDELITDPKGQWVPGERAAIDRSFKHMERSLAEKGIQLALNDQYDYKAIQPAAAATPARPAAPEPTVPSTPTAPDMG